MKFSLPSESKTFSALALAATFMPPLGAILLLSNISDTGDWLLAIGTLAPLVYVASFWILGGLGFLPTYAQCAVAGYTFGAYGGIALIPLGFAGAALVGSSLARRMSAEDLEQLIQRKPKVQAIYQALLNSGWGKTFFVCTLIRLLPHAPFALSNVVLGGLKTAPSAIVLGAAVGLMPRGAVAVYAGATYAQLGSLGDPKVSNVLIGLGITLAVLFIFAYMAKRGLAKMTRGQSCQIPATIDESPPQSVVKSTPLKAIGL